MANCFFTLKGIKMQHQNCNYGASSLGLIRLIPGILCINHFQLQLTSTTGDISLYLQNPCEDGVCHDGNHLFFSYDPLGSITPALSLVASRGQQPFVCSRPVLDFFRQFSDLMTFFWILGHFKCFLLVTEKLSEADALQLRGGSKST